MVANALVLASPKPVLVGDAHAYRAFVGWRGRSDIRADFIASIVVEPLTGPLAELAGECLARAVGATTPDLLPWSADLFGVGLAERLTEGLYLRQRLSRPPAFSLLA
jgi:hypothetical protein